MDDEGYPDAIVKGAVAWDDRDGCSDDEEGIDGAALAVPMMAPQEAVGVNLSLRT